MKAIAAIAFFFFLNIPARSQEVNFKIQVGNDRYELEQYKEAELAYKDALTVEPGNLTAKYNLANALYKQNKYADAAKLYEEIAGFSTEKDWKAKASYNGGVIFSGQKKLEESIEAYKNALRNNPNDKEARENLQKALLELKKQPKQDKKDDNQKQPQPQPSKMKQSEAERRLNNLEQKEKEVKERMQKEKSKNSGGKEKDW